MGALTFFAKMLLVALAASLLLPAGTACAKPQEVKSSLTRKQAQAAEQRKKNRERLMKKKRQRVAVVPLTPTQKRREAENKRLARAKNRETLAMHPRWRPGYLGGSDALRQSHRESSPSPKAQVALKTVIARLKQQLGKPYVWGGQSPEEGFDCSGLVFYAWNHVLDRKLPRTANGMYQARHLHTVHSGKLRRGDLVFFNISRRPGADHVGVYLGDGKFIEAPRRGLNIRISRLDNNFWQAHYLGARRVLTDDLS